MVKYLQAKSRKEVKRIISKEKVVCVKKRLGGAISVLNILKDDFNNPNGSSSDKEKRKALECIIECLSQLDEDVEGYLFGGQ